jgi:hypothetical protein
VRPHEVFGAEPAFTETARFIKVGVDPVITPAYHRVRNRLSPCLCPTLPSSENKDPTAQPPPRPEPAGREMSGASAVRQAPARRAQPALVFRQIVAPVQPGHALGTALIESGGQRLLAGFVTTALTGKDRDPRDPARKKFRAASLDPEHHPRRTSRFGKPSAVKGRISLPPSFSRSSHASAGRVGPALT